jgi:hypothetical protein
MVDDMQSVKGEVMQPAAREADGQWWRRACSQWNWCECTTTRRWAPRYVVMSIGCVLSRAANVESAGRGEAMYIEGGDFCSSAMQCEAALQVSGAEGARVGVCKGFGMWAAPELHRSDMHDACGLTTSR